MTGDDSIKIGSRIVSEGYIGTILYKGQVPPTQGFWLGIDWDEPSRGKHNGCHEGKRYFITRYRTSGSFVRISKVEFGISFYQAIQDRYGKVEGKENVLFKRDECFINTILQNQKEIEIIGIDALSSKQSQFDKLEEVVLHNTNVCCTHFEHNLRILTPNIRDLDISKNLFVSWVSIVEITEQLSQLQTLNVSENRLQLPDEPAKFSKALSGIRSLVLNKMDYTWQQILICVEMFPSLEQLVACFNQISSIEKISSHIQKLIVLDLSNNPLKNWDQILHLGSLPRLEKLTLSYCGLQKILFPPCLLSDTSDLFRCLKSLSLTGNMIDSWSSINELNKLPHLQELKIKNNPVLALENPETTRQLLIAKLRNLTMCNRSMISAEERRGAEIDYLKKYGQVWLKSGGHQDPKMDNPSADFLNNHPQYQELIQKYGAPEDSELKVETTTLKNNLINIKITCPDDTNMKSLNKKIPITMTVQKLLTLVQRLYKINSQDIKLSYFSSKVPGLEVNLDNAMKEIGYYSIENGDTVYVRW